jgi:outer membrane protein assembly factor BamB
MERPRGAGRRGGATSRTVWWVLLLLVASIAPAQAEAATPAAPGEWPQLWGPAGDGRSPFPAGLGGAATVEAREVWRRPIGSGFSGIAVSGGRAYTGLSDGAQDHAVAVDVASGRELWRTSLGETYRGHDGSKDGPIATPSVDEGRVFMVGPHGAVVALDAATGRALWRHDLKAEYGAPPPVYGFGTSPLVAGDLLVVQAGGAKAHNVVAFDKKTGRLAWSAAHGSATGYATPVHATIAGVPQLVAVSGDKVFGLRAGDGTLVWSHTLPAETERSRPPLVLPDGRILVPSWTESIMLRVTGPGGAFTVSELWRSPRLKQSYSPTVFHDGHLYGFNGAWLVCASPDDGAVLWRQKVYSGSLILVDGHLVILGDNSGDLRIAEATPKGYREKLKAPVFNAGAASTTGPSFAGGRLLLRNVEEIVALEIVG